MCGFRMGMLHGVYLLLILEIFPERDFEAASWDQQESMSCLISDVCPWPVGTVTIYSPHQCWGEGMTEDEMAGWHHRLDGREFE